MNYKNVSNYDFKKDSKPETKSLLKNSRTVPDQNYSMREILNKFTTGQPINGMGTYNDFDGDYDANGKEFVDFNEYQPHPNTLDLVDRKALEQKNKKELKKLQDAERERRNPKPAPEPPKPPVPPTEPLPGK